MRQAGSTPLRSHALLLFQSGEVYGMKASAHRSARKARPVPAMRLARHKKAESWRENGRRAKPGARRAQALG
jgi:hypothetical protein